MVVYIFVASLQCMGVLCIRTWLVCSIRVFGIFNSEIILTCQWGILVIGGIIVQLLLTRKRQKFPDSLYKRFERWNSRRENNSINSRNNIRRAQESFHSSTTSGMENDERRRLLSFDSMPVSNYATITSNDVIK